MWPSVSVVVRAHDAIGICMFGVPKHVFLMVAMYCAYLNFSVMVICALNTLDIFHNELISL